MSRTEDEFISLQDAIALVTDKFGKNSNVTKILEKLMKVMVSETGEWYSDVIDDIYGNDYFDELEELCR